MSEESVQLWELRSREYDREVRAKPHAGHHELNPSLSGRASPDLSALPFAPSPEREVRT
ncbi:MAG TPA: hypothetical protein VIU11_22850 [Nakamurella sp.]